MEQTTLGYNNESFPIDHSSYFFNRKIVPGIYMIIIIVGILGNGLLVYTITAYSAMRTVSNIFLLSLSIGDLLVIVVSAPLRVMVYLLDSWVCGWFLCAIYEFTIDLSQGVSIFTLTALAWDRYVAIVLPMSALTWSTKKRTIIIAVILWLLAIIFAVPNIVTSRVLTYIKHGNTTQHVCSLLGTIDEEMLDYHPYVITRRIVNLFVYFIIPFVIITVTYVAIAVSLGRSSSSKLTDETCSTNNENLQKQMAARKHIAKIVLVIVVLFFVCWFPRRFFIFYISYTTQQFNYNDVKILIFFSFLLPFVNSCINPPVLYFMGSKFKRYFDHCLFGRCCPSKRLQLSQRQSDGQLTTITQVRGNKLSVDISAS